MNKIYLWGVIVTAAMLGFTYVSFDFKHGAGDIVNILAIAGAALLVVITVFVVIKYVRQMQTDTADGELEEDSWDGIGEYKNPVPFGWGVMFLVTMAWGMWYFTMGYPVNSYSQIGEYNEDTALHNAKFEKKYASITGDKLVEMGESVFLAECKVCHGLAADGIDGTAANLNERISKKSVKYVLEHGSNHKLLGMEVPMPDKTALYNANTNAMLSDEEAEAVASYVANGMSGEGANVFAGTCAACHGANGEGMDGVSPNIKNFDAKLIVNVLNHGLKGSIGSMPAFERLNKKQKEAVAAYIVQLKN